MSLMDRVFGKPTPAPDLPAPRASDWQPATYDKLLGNHRQAPARTASTSPGWGPTNDRAIRNAVWDKTGGKCAACRVPLSPSTGRATSFEVDHIVPKSRGGIDHLSNYQPLCRRCNGRKSNNHARSYLAA